VVLVVYAAIAFLALGMAYSFVTTAQILLTQPLLVTLAVAAGLIYWACKR